MADLSDVLIADMEQALNAYGSTSDIEAHEVLALIAEVRRRRAAPSVVLTEEDRRTLEFARSSVLDDRENGAPEMSRKERESHYGRQYDAALRLFDRLLAAPAGGKEGE